ncbi:indoleamine 2,3-dioxygenase 1 [Tachysurus vachellii]|uniref:indoleamine 2,3-dioxygenase 1 n=1 Tax=Tachysurus vachellii TaxID=175792 RepID=UPI00296AF3AD|nr:indoleamine 2,3-dioxygenase 1 [Tachysurus vachellii]XP_060737273.1 indoleamine 2,3-dioxygenase 1 [Tachysurus vachellii]
MEHKAADSDAERSLSLKRYHISEEYGFALSDPLVKLPLYFQPWMDIAERASELVSAHALRSSIHKMPQLETDLLQSHRELRLAHLALSIITMCYVWQEGEEDKVKVLPQNLAVPYWEVSQKLGLPPILTHADGVLANWRKREPDGPLDMENLELLFSLPGGESVRGFFLVTLLVELAAVPALKAIPEVIGGVCDGDVSGVIRGLDVISLSIDDMKKALKQMHVYVDPSVFYGIMRIFLSGWKDNPSMAEGLVYEGVQAEPMEFSGGSAAQSSLLHSFDELLGIKHEEKSANFLTRMRDYMPPSHRCFIDEISRAPSLKAFVLNQANDGLTEAFDRCVAQLVSLRSYHISVVSRFITVPASRAKQLRYAVPESLKEHDPVWKGPMALEERGTGGSGIMSFLKTVRDRTKDVSISARSDI